MNEKIQKLAEEAGIDTRTMGFEGNQHHRDPWNARLTKFFDLAREDAFGLPTIEDASQNWGKVDGAVAWHLIERHAENWADVGKMMDEYVAAKLGDRNE
jgi:hypothetical protein